MQARLRGTKPETTGGILGDSDVILAAPTPLLNLISAKGTCFSVESIETIVGTYPHSSQMVDEDAVHPVVAQARRVRLNVPIGVITARPRVHTSKAVTLSVPTHIQPSRSCANRYDHRIA